MFFTNQAFMIFLILIFYLFINFIFILSNYFVLIIHTFPLNLQTHLFKLHF